MSDSSRTIRRSKRRDRYMYTRTFKRTVCVFLLAALVINLWCPVFAAEQDFDVKVDNAILIDAKSGQILFQKNIHDRRPPASLTKLMSTLLVMEELENGVVTLED